MRLLPTLALICLLGLGGCSYTFRVEAVMVDGRLAFVPDTASRGRAKCVSHVMVMDAAAPTADSHAEGSQTAHVWRDHGGYACTDRFPLFYGEALNGEDDAGTSASGEVAAQPLREGVIYVVMIASGAMGYGGGRFRLLPDGRVENLRQPVLIGEDAPLVTPRL